MTPGRRPGWPHVYTFLFLLHLFLCPVDLAGNSAFDTQRPAVGLATDARLCSGVPTASLKPDWEGSALSPQEGVPTGAAPPAAAVKWPGGGAVDSVQTEMPLSSDTSRSDSPEDLELWDACGTTATSNDCTTWPFLQTNVRTTSLDGKGGLSTLSRPSNHIGCLPRYRPASPYSVLMHQHEPLCASSVLH